MKYLRGLIVKKPSEKAPDFVLASVAIKRQELIETLQAMDDEWINGSINKWDKDGEDKVYFKIDEWKPKKDDLPF